jgi:hypothetical protein
MLDQLPQNASPAGKLGDPAPRLLIYSRRAEALKLSPRLAQHSKRRIPRTRQLTRRLDHTLEHHVKIKLADDPLRHLEHATHPAALGRRPGQLLATRYGRGVLRPRPNLAYRFASPASSHIQRPWRVAAHPASALSRTTHASA